VSGSLLNQRNKAMLDKTLLNQDALERYKSASTVRQIAERMGAYHHLHDFHRPYTGATAEEYTEWRIQEAMVGYEAGQNDSPLPRWIGHYAKKAIQDIQSFDGEWWTGNDSRMSASELLNRGRELIRAARINAEVAFTIAEVEADPLQIYRHAFEEIFSQCVKKLETVESDLARFSKVSPSARKRLKEQISREVRDQILPIMNKAIPILESMRETLAPI